jgi:hypothetical protein
MPTAEETLASLVAEVLALKNQLNNQLASQPAGVKEPRATLPEKFNGTRSQFRGFMNQISLVFQLNPTRYESDATKVATVGTLLHGDALAWFNPLLENQSAHSETLNSWPLFKKSLTDTFGELDLETISASKIRTLLQGNQTASSYASKFRQLSSDLSWNEAALMFQYRMGLNKEIKNMLVFADRPTTIAGLIDLSIRCDQRLAENKNETATANAQPSSALSHYSSQTKNLTPSDAMDLDSISSSSTSRPRGPLTPAERQFRYSNNLCIICGSQDHLKLNCPKKRPTTQIAAINVPQFTPYPSNQIPPTLQAF